MTAARPAPDDDGGQAGGGSEGQRVPRPGRVGQRQAGCLAGGGPAPDDDTLEHWLQVPPVPGWARFAIGRGIWWDPLHVYLRRLCTAGDARRRITNTYLRYARYYLSAREGTLATEPDAVIR